MSILTQVLNFSRKSLYSQVIALILLIGFSSGGLTGCILADAHSSSRVQGDSLELSNSCQVKEDQKGSFMPKVALGGPQVLRVDASFTAEQKLAIEQAVATWNALGNRLIGRGFFQMEVVRLNSSERPSQNADCDFEGSSASSFALVRESTVEGWKSLGFGSRNPAVTLRCYRDRQLSKQVVLVNTLYVHPQQLSSTVLHELGHALGLDHSCQLSGGKADFLSCQGILESHSYRQAVMYPTLRVSRVLKVSEETGEKTEEIRPEIKEDLGINDQERAGCLYQ